MLPRSPLSSQLLLLNAEILAPRPQTAPMLETADSALKALASTDAKDIPPTSPNSSSEALNEVILAPLLLTAPQLATADFALKAPASTDADLLKIKLMFIHAKRD